MFSRSPMCKKISANFRKKDPEEQKLYPKINNDFNGQRAKTSKRLFCSLGPKFRRPFQNPTWPGFISWRSEGADVPDPQDPTILKEGFFSLGFKNKFAGYLNPATQSWSKACSRRVCFKKNLEIRGFSIQFQTDMGCSVLFKVWLTM